MIYIHRIQRNNWFVNMHHDLANVGGLENDWSECTEWVLEHHFSYQDFHGKHAYTEYITQLSGCARVFPSLLFVYVLSEVRELQKDQVSEIMVLLEEDER